MDDDNGPWDADDLFGEPEDDDVPEETESGGRADAERDDEPRPAERLLYALGQLYKLYRHDALNVRPEHFDVWDLAGIIGVRNDIEFISEDRRGSHWHFAGEVLHVNPAAGFPWRLLTVWEWAAEAEASAPRADESGD